MDQTTLQPQARSPHRCPRTKSARSRANPRTADCLLVSRTAAVVALAALIYYVLITELSSIMANDLEEKPKKAAKRKETPNVRTGLPQLDGS